MKYEDWEVISLKERYLTDLSHEEKTGKVK